MKPNTPEPKEYNDPRLGYPCLTFQMEDRIVTGPAPLMQYVLRELAAQEVKMGYTCYNDTKESGLDRDFIRSVNIIAQDDSSAATVRYNIRTGDIEAVEAEPAELLIEKEIVVTSPYEEAAFYREERKRGLDRVADLLELTTLSEKTERAKIHKLCAKLWPASKIIDADQGVFLGKNHYRVVVERELLDMADVNSEHVVKAKTTGMSEEQRAKLEEVSAFFKDAIEGLIRIEVDDSLSSGDKLRATVASMNGAKGKILEAKDAIPPAEMQSMLREIDDVLAFVGELLRGGQEEPLYQGIKSIDGTGAVYFSDEGITGTPGADLSLCSGSLMSNGADFSVDYILSIQPEGYSNHLGNLLDTYRNGDFIFKTADKIKFSNGTTLSGMEAIVPSYSVNPMSVILGAGLPEVHQDFPLAFDHALNVAGSGLTATETTEPEKQESASASLLERFIRWARG